MKARATLTVLGLVAFRASALLEPLYRARPQILLDPPALVLPPGLLETASWTLLAFGLLLAVESLLYRTLFRVSAMDGLEATLNSYQPLAFLLVFCIAFAPGLPLVPMIGWWLLLDARAWLLTLALGACVYFKASFVLERAGRIEWSWTRWFDSPRALVAFSLFLLALLLLWAPSRRFTQPYDERWGTGDEPRYVRITASLLHDGDADIGNAAEHVGRRADGRELLRGLAGILPATLTSASEAWGALGGTTPAGTARSLGGGVIEGRTGGTYYSFLPGLPLLLVPAMALDSVLAPDRLAATLVLCLLTSVLSMALLVPVVSPALGSRAETYALVLALALSLPSFFYHFQVYTEVPAAICLAIVFLVLRGASLSWSGALAFGLACAYLPWLHSKYLLFWGVAGLSFLVRARRHRFDPGKATIALALPALAFALNCLYVFHITGSLLPDSLWVIRGYERGASLLSRSTFPGLYYLLVDRSEGLFVYGPLYAFAVAGWLSLYRWSRYEAALFLAFTLPYLMATASHDQGGAGGWSPPARYLVPLVPLLALSLGAWLRSEKHRTVRLTVLLVAATGSFWIARGMVVERNFPYDRPAFLGSLIVDPSPALGSVTEPEPLLRRAAYPLFLLTGLVALAALERRESRLTPARTALAVPLFVLMSGSLVSLWSPASHWIHPAPSRGPTRLRAGSPASLLLPTCNGGSRPSLRLRSEGERSSAVALTGPGLERTLNVPSGVESELPVEVPPVLRLSENGWIRDSVVTLLVDDGEPPVDVEAGCSGERAP